MQTSQLGELEAELSVEEGVKHYLYDDATGKQFVKGMTLVGNLTIAIGVNLSEGMDDAEVKWISEYRIEKILDALRAKYPWFVTLNWPRQDAIADIAFNIGLAGLTNWPKFLAAMAANDFTAAVAEISSNQKWISQVHSTRATRVEKMITDGAYPEDV